MLQNVAEKNGWHKFISMQNYHNLLYREEEREMIPYCKATGVGLVPVRLVFLAPSDVTDRPHSGLQSPAACSHAHGAPTMLHHCALGQTSHRLDCYLVKTQSTR